MIFRHIHLWFNDLKLRNKFIIIITAVMAFMGAGSAVSANIQSRDYDKTLYKQSVQMLTMLSQSVQSELDNTAMVSFSIIGDNVLQNSLTNLQKHTPYSNSWLESKDMVSNRLMNISLMHSNIKSIYLRTVDGMVFSRITSQAAIPTDILEEGFKQAQNAGGREIWIPGDTNSGSIFLIRDVREIAELSLNSIAVLAMRVSLKQIVDKCCSPLTQMKLPLLCSVELDNTRVYVSDNRIGELDSHQDSDYSLKKIGRNYYFIVKHSPPKSRWTYTMALSYDSIVSSKGHALIRTLFLIAGTMLMSFLVIILMTSSLWKHFDRLLQKYNSYAKNMLIIDQNDSYQNRKDEIGELHRQFNKMASEHRKMVEENYLKQQLLLEAQLRQLQAQIQPHFLYNTLESIYCLALENEDQRIAVMTSSLGNLLRASLNEMNDVITIRRDIEISKEYLKIQMIRYENALQVEYDIDEKYMELQIPAMTIQPLVENAIHHGLEEMLDTCEIRVFCEPSGDYVNLVIEDNGPGMDPEVIKKLNSGELKPDGLGIGLRNINQRLKLFFQDDNCRIIIKRVNDRTQVIVCVRGVKKTDA